MATDFVPTRASLLKGKGPEDHQQVTFVAYKSKKKLKIEEIKEETKAKEDLEFNLRKAKHEVIKLGMSGFDPVKKEQAKIQQLINLGAKPPKNKCKNYKQLLTEKKIEKVKSASEQQFRQIGKNSVGKSTAKGKSFDKKRRKGKEGILDIYGKILKSKAKLPK